MISTYIALLLISLLVGDVLATDTVQLDTLPFCDNDVLGDNENAATGNGAVDRQQLGKR